MTSLQTKNKKDIDSKCQSKTSFNFRTRRLNASITFVYVKSLVDSALCEETMSDCICLAREGKQEQEKTEHDKYLVT